MMTTASRKSIDISGQAAEEILAQGNYYRECGMSNQLSLRWQRAVTDAIELLLRFPEMGTLCRLRSERLEGMRRLAIRGFRDHSIYYFISKKEPEIRIVRVVHGARDLESVLRETDL